MNNLSILCKPGGHTGSPLQRRFVGATLCGRPLIAAEYSDRIKPSYIHLTGRGTAALYLAFRALALRDGPGEVILPDLLCSTALDAILLAGHVPVFADVIPARWTLDPADALNRITNRTRAVLVAHLFGHIAHFPREPFAARGIPIVEDAIQGIGGTIGSFADVTVIGFADSKLIGGRGGVVMTDAPELAQVIKSIPLPESHFSLDESDPRVRAYAAQLLASAPDLIRPFNDSADNIARIQRGWQSLAENIQQRNACAEAWRTGLSNTPLILPDVQSGDAFWRFTFAAPTLGLASAIAHKLQMANIPGTRLYPSLDRWLGGSDQEVRYSTSIAPRLINLWVIPPIAPNNDMMQRAIGIIQLICDLWVEKNIK